MLKYSISVTITWLPLVFRCLCYLGCRRSVDCNLRRCCHMGDAGWVWPVSGGSDMVQLCQVFQWFHKSSLVLLQMRGGV